MLYLSIEKPQKRQSCFNNGTRVWASCTPVKKGDVVTCSLFIKQSNTYISVEIFQEHNSDKGCLSSVTNVIKKRLRGKRESRKRFNMKYFGTKVPHLFVSLK